MIEWISAEGSNPAEGHYLVAVNTDDGKIVTALDFDGRNWIHEGEPTFCHAYYFCVTHYAPLPEPPHA